MTDLIPRPVWARRERRLVGMQLDPPTDAEKADAILVLREGITIPLSLYAEAEAIMLEANDGKSYTFSDLISVVDEDFIDDRELA